MSSFEADLLQLIQTRLGQRELELCEEIQKEYSEEMEAREGELRLMREWIHLLINELKKHGITPIPQPSLASPYV